MTHVKPRNRQGWQRHKYKLNGVILLLPLLFLYQSLNPRFPEAWSAQRIGQFEIAPMPLDLKPPYAHHEKYVKDFYVAFTQGEISDIRQAYLTIGPTALSLSTLQQGDDGILHGSRHGQHAHAIAPANMTPADRLWLTLETWQGDVLVLSWPIPDTLISAS